MRVLHIHSGNMYGGVESMLATLARHRDSCPEVESHFALCFEGRVGEELRALGAQVHRLPGVRVSRPASVWRSRRALAGLLGERRFDVAVCHSAWTQAIFGKVVRSASLPLVFWSHDAATGAHWLERWASRTPPDLAICNSAYTARALRSFYPETRAEVLYCPVELPNLSQYQTPESRAAVRTELDTPRDAVVVIQVSRMEPCKGHLLHLRALSSLLRHENWVCWMVGGSQRKSEKSYETNLQAEAARLGVAGRLRFLGQRYDVARILAAADIYSQPNVSPEAFGITFVEAMHAGLPVVTTAIGGAKEVVDDSCGFLVASHNVNELVERLGALLADKNLRRRIGRAGPSRARHLCEPAGQLRRLSLILKDAVEASSNVACA